MRNAEFGLRNGKPPTSETARPPICCLHSAFRNPQWRNTVTRQLFDLTGRVALVTGGSKGLGRAMARGLAEAGADVVISSRHEDQLKVALEEVLAGTGRKGAYAVA